MKRTPLQRALRWVFYRGLGLLGIPLRDVESGRVLARILPWPHRGRLRLFGLPDFLPIQLLPRLEPPRTLQSISLEARLQPLPDEPSLTGQSPNSAAPKVLVTMLAHQSASKVRKFVENWLAAGLAPEDLLVLHGGREEDCAELDFPNKVFLPDPALRRTPQREENQSHRAVLQGIAGKLSGHTHVFYGEYDLCPLVPCEKLLAQVLRHLEREQADVLFPTLYRVDGTCQEIYFAAGGA